MFDLSYVAPIVGIAGVIIGGMVGLYTIYEKLVKNRPILAYKILRHRVHNSVHPKNEEAGEALVEILIDIGNKGRGVLSVSGVFINSKEKGYLIWSHCEDAMEKKEVRSFTLTEGKWKHLRLFYKGPLYKKDFLKCEVEIHLTGKRKPIVIPLELPKGTTWDYGVEGPLD